MANLDTLKKMTRDGHNVAKTASAGTGGGGGGLPAVTSEDNGDVLTVVEGVWAKAAPSGGMNDAFFVDFTDEVNVVEIEHEEDKRIYVKYAPDAGYVSDIDLAFMIHDFPEHQPHLVTAFFSDRIDEYSGYNGSGCVARDWTLMPLYALNETEINELDAGNKYLTEDCFALMIETVLGANVYSITVFPDTAVFAEKIN